MSLQDEKNKVEAEAILDKVEQSYIDFRKTYAVVDGHYTLKELEALLVLARMELAYA